MKLHYHLTLSRWQMYRDILLIQILEVGRQDLESWWCWMLPVGTPEELPIAQISSDSQH